jgi:hypothetical protein
LQPRALASQCRRQRPGRERSVHSKASARLWAPRSRGSIPAAQCGPIARARRRRSPASSGGRDTIGGVTAAEIGIGIAAASAVASAVSAYQSVRAVALSNRPFVVGHEYREWTQIIRQHDYELGVVGVSLRNEGPGLALDVRWRARSWSWDIDTGWQDPIGSIRSGDGHQASIPFDLPDGVTEVELGLRDAKPGAGEPNYLLWYVETQFNDVRGATWLVRPEGVFSFNYRSRRVRSHKLHFWRPPGSRDPLHDISRGSSSLTGSGVRRCIRSDARRQHPSRSRPLIGALHMLDDAGDDSFASACARIERRAGHCGRKRRPCGRIRHPAARREIYTSVAERPRDAPGGRRSATRDPCAPGGEVGRWLGVAALRSKQKRSRPRVRWCEWSWCETRAVCRGDSRSARTDPRAWGPTAELSRLIERSVARVASAMAGR